MGKYVSNYKTPQREISYDEDRKRGNLVRISILDLHKDNSQETTGCSTTEEQLVLSFSLFNVLLSTI